MKTRFRFIMVLLGITTAAIVIAGVPLGKQTQGASKAELAGCYTELEVTSLMEAGHYQREEAIVLLNLACEYAIAPN